jgi:hypothetical protein
VSLAAIARSPAPDLVVPVVGFRQWRLHDGLLRSLYSEAQWPSAVITARCPRRDHDPRDVPASHCTCGIYAYYDPCPRTASAATPDFVAGAVVLWGALELHATGMRAEHARIVALELPLSRGRKRRAVTEIAERLSVAAVKHRKLRAATATHGLPLQRALRPGHAVAEVGCCP